MYKMIVRILARLWRIKYLIVVLFFLFFMSVFAFQITGFYRKSDSFQEFSYPSMINLYKILEFNDTDIVPKLFHYQPTSIQLPDFDNRIKVKMMIIVKSSLKNVQKREEIRLTWGSNKCMSAHNFQIYFALGQSFDDDKVDLFSRNQVKKESDTKKDIIQFDFRENYENNTYKVFSILDYFVKYHSDVRYLVIVDDDYFVDPSVLSDTIENEITEREYPQFLGGHVWFQTRPVRNILSKWFVSYIEYQYDYYPPYAAGGFLLISNPMVKLCHKLLPYLKFNPFDDVLLGILLFKLKIYPSHISTIYMHPPNPFPSDLLACHGFSEKLKDFWDTNQYIKKCNIKSAQ